MPKLNKTNSSETDSDEEKDEQNKRPGDKNKNPSRGTQIVAGVLPGLGDYDSDSSSSNSNSSCDDDDCSEGTGALLSKKQLTQSAAGKLSTL